MKTAHVQIIAQKYNLDARQVSNTIQLLKEGATIPFISRYRKEATGSLNEVQIAAIKKEWERLEELEARRETILTTIAEQGKLTDDLRKKIESTYDTTTLEDLYLPYKPKRKTRASVARDKGLQPLADRLLQQTDTDCIAVAQQFVNDKVATADDALQGARDIVAEYINEHEQARNTVRHLFGQEAQIHCKAVKGKEDEGATYRDYFDYHEALRRCPSHRLLAILRGEEEGFLRVTVEPSEQKANEALQNVFVQKKATPAAREQMQLAITDGYSRLLQPSIETEFRQRAKEQADNEAIDVFARNLRQLLLSAPLGSKRVLAIDPGYRTGCKVVCLDQNGTLLHNETIYPHKPQGQEKLSGSRINNLVESYHIEAIAIGNGTAGRETEQFIKRIGFKHDVKVFVVSESGASIYSASQIARDEFPDYDVTVRGAVSIGRRLMDPLAELVKIDPKSIGVGQYQHDVEQNKLKERLDAEVESCVNLVGVNLNTASQYLLTYISGVGSVLASNIVKYRAEKGLFRSRKQLLEVPRLGNKAYEQCAGFLRIPEADNPLDNSAIHPEAYHVVEKMATDAGVQVNDLLKDAAARNRIDINRYVTGTIGLPTLTDIMHELAKPGRDPRSMVKVLEFDEKVKTIDDLNVGMVLQGIVTNITNFGAFVDIGIKENGLVHISQISDKRINNPADVLQLHQHVKVKVISIDMERKRIQLSMKGI